MHIENAIHLLTHQHTAYLKESTFHRFRQSWVHENHDLCDNPPPDEDRGSGRLLYVYDTVVCWLSEHSNDRFLYQFVHCRSPPSDQ